MDQQPLLPGQSSPEIQQKQADADFPVVEEYCEECPVYLIRNQKVMLDTDVARLYEVETRTLIRAVRREIQRFPVDFLFKLTGEEFEELQGKAPNGVRFERSKSTPYAFTEAGVVMVSQVLNSARALHVNINLVRSYIRLNKFCSSNADLAQKLAQMETKYDQHLGRIYQALETMHGMIKPPPQRRIGFHTP